MPNVCNVDGKIVPEAEAVVPVLDRGFLFGDSVYEVLRTRQGIPFAWREHLQRLRSSAAAITMPVEVGDRDLMARIVTTIRASFGRADAAQERYIRLIVTRGTGSGPRIDLAAAPGPLRIVVIVRALDPAAIGRPVRAAVVRRRSDPGVTADPQVKSGNYRSNISGLAEARARGADECVFVDELGHVTEASTANLYAVFGGAVRTPPIGRGLLAGITRALLIRCAADAGMLVEEVPIAAASLQDADEIFLSGTVRDLAPVVALDDRSVGSGAAGVVTARLQQVFAAWCAERAADDGDALRELGVA